MMVLRHIFIHSKVQKSDQYKTKNKLQITSNSTSTPFLRINNSVWCVLNQS